MPDSPCQDSEALGAVAAGPLPAYAIGVAAAFKTRRKRRASGIGQKGVSGVHSVIVPCNVRLISWTLRSSSGESGATRLCVTRTRNSCAGVSDRPLYEH
jgi:hypothetical protein